MEAGVSLTHTEPETGRTIWWEEEERATRKILKQSQGVDLTLPWTRSAQEQESS